MKPIWSTERCNRREKYAWKKGLNAPIPMFHTAYTSKYRTTNGFLGNAFTSVVARFANGSRTNRSGGSNAAVAPITKAICFAPVALPARPDVCIQPGNLPARTPQSTPNPMPHPAQRLYPDARLRSVVSAATTGTSDTTQIEDMIPATKAVPTSHAPPSGAVRHMHNSATPAELQISVHFNPKRRTIAAAGNEPAILPADIAPATQPRKSSLYPRSSRYRL